MQTVTITEAKARLNALVEAAERGEQVVLMRGSKLVAAIVPVSAQDFDLTPRLSDAQAERLWGALRSEQRDGATMMFDSPSAAVAALAGPAPAKAPRRKGTRRG
jgi:prevent-host-death family protein